MLILDTHTLVWWVDGNEKLSAAVSQAIMPFMKQSGSLLASSISIWELTLVSQKKPVTTNSPVA
jgi:PIN domain nuclease of toxin-antitoxin system